MDTIKLYLTQVELDTLIEAMQQRINDLQDKNAPYALHTAQALLARLLQEA